MFASFKKLIFGVPPTITKASQEVATVATSPTTHVSNFNYLPASQVPENGVIGVADDGSCWEEWRVDPHTGEQWYRRTSEVVSVDTIPEIHGIDNCEPNDEEVNTSDEFDEEDVKRKLMFRERYLNAAKNPYGVPLLEDNPNDDE